MADSEQEQGYARHVRLRGIAFFLFRFGVFSSEELVAHERNDRDREHERHQYRNGQSDGQRREKLSDDTFEES